MPGVVNLVPRIAQGLAAIRDHAAGTFPDEVLGRIESLLPESMERTAETGCGKSTILFSNLSHHHTVFCIDDRGDGDRSSVLYFEANGMTRSEVVHCVFGPTQTTLPRYTHQGRYDCVLLDGPHGYPFPELEYYHLYPHIRQGGFLLVDDVQIPTIGRLADFVQEDEMFELVELVGTTAVFRRTAAETFNPTGDGWWTQRFNRRRIPPASEFHCADGKRLESFRDRVSRTYLASASAAVSADAPTAVHGIVPRIRRAARMLLEGQ